MSSRATLPTRPALAAAPAAAAATGAEQTLATARAALAQAAPALGLAPGDAAAARVVQVLSTVVFEVAGGAGRLAVKVYPGDVDAARLQAVARVLPAAGEVWAAQVAGPVVTASGTVTAYPWLEQSPPVGWGEIGALLRRWHDVPVDLAQLPRWTPLVRVPDQVAAYRAAPGADAELAELALRTRRILLARVAELRSGLGVGAVHGDLSPSNVMRRDGRPVLIDGDFVAAGPREYDLVSAALRRERGEIDEADYLEFCSAYGYDVRQWDGLGLVEEICSLGAVTFGMWCAAQRLEDTSWVASALARWC
ncbi:Ser/Thr protein kinase RdoA (MazF antagonist) [Motilibacter peucedani]|uniref:Ser/Thr protein kinase RdoA (MazF antagonist) n=1 Tax=Motilibacter peucedani TaxID=598650 RepID=A0A420XLS5_9ACTN|nr:aminoglycoside phosphotransferase family protein [Motilibacter peucedani]RKS69307.1 Ser/Thr protein kinase RdoA (MazF antagonist) [Motilibacter peucedani]